MRGRLYRFRRLEGRVTRFFFLSGNINEWRGASFLAYLLHRPYGALREYLVSVLSIVETKELQKARRDLHQPISPARSPASAPLASIAAVLRVCCTDTGCSRLNRGTADCPCAEHFAGVSSIWRRAALSYTGTASLADYWHVLRMACPPGKPACLSTRACIQPLRTEYSVLI
jgi:hypothetical protein